MTPQTIPISSSDLPNKLLRSALFCLSVCLQAGLDHVIVCTSVSSESADGSPALPKIYFRTYSMAFKKSGTKVPNVALVEMGPSMDLTFRRTKFASEELYGQACKRPKQLKVKKTKNVGENEMGDKVGRIHMDRQDLNKMEVRKVKALRATSTTSEGGSESDRKRKASALDA